MSVRSLTLGVITMIAMAIILIVMIEGRRPVDVGSEGTWGGAGGVEFWGGVARDQNTEKVSIQDLLSGQRRDDRITLQRTELASPTSAEETDFTGLLGQLLAPVEETITTPGAYDFIPRGFISTSSAAPKTQSPLQEQLYGYGNDIGNYLRTFEDSHANMLTILKDAREDMGNSAKADAAAQVGTDYRILARDLRAMSVPEIARTLHASFADANEAVGKNMETLARVKTDQEFLDAVDVYNKSVEAYTEKFVALASLFVANEVSFSESDPGSVFTFRGTVSGF